MNFKLYQRYKFIAFPTLQAINDDLYKFLKPREKKKGNVFINPETGKPPREYKRAWKTALKKAKIENFRFHDLRHTVASRLADRGVPVPIIQELLAHTDIKTTMRYVHNKKCKRTLSLIISYG